WSQSPSSLLASYGSIRGASSFGVSYPKVYIDGIEVANPLLITQIVPENIDRIEVIRGPQGAALYGADAISGVVNIITRHEGTDPGEPMTRVQSTAGVTTSDFSSRPVLSQEHALSLRTGSSLNSAGLDLSVRSLGAFYPGASSEHFTLSGSTRLTGSSTSLTGTARFFAKSAGASTNPLLANVVPPPAMGTTGPPSPTLADNQPQSVKEYTLGATGKYAANERWTHT